MLPSTWHPRPRHGTLDPRPSTLDKKIDSLLLSYLSWILRVFLVAKIVRLVIAHSPEVSVNIPTA